MCGIFGWIPSENHRRENFGLYAESLMEAMKHRGPDDRGYAAFDAQTGEIYHDKAERSFDALLGQTRLSIIDLSPAGHQPMFSDDKRYSIVFNGEIYNYLELRKELEAEGIRFSTAGDTEVLLRAVVHWGTAALSRLVGMFAFAIFDREKKTLFCARDFFGIKPLYWHRGKMGFCFASELLALLKFPDVPRLISANSAYKYLCWGTTNDGDSCMLDDIYQLPPAHYIKINLSAPDEVVPTRYWKPDLSLRSKLSFDDAAAQLREMFLDSVKMHLRSDVPLGVALSGGIDSSAVTCAVRHLQPETDLHTFSFIAKGSKVSEEHWANIVAQHTKAVRHTVEVEPKELARDLDSMIYHLGEPFGSTSVYAQYRVFKLAKECGITVTLDGQGADELLAGYFGYPSQRIETLFRHGNISKALKFLNAVSALPGRNKKNIILSSVYSIAPDWFRHLARKILRRDNISPAWVDMDSVMADGAKTEFDDKKLIDELYPSRNKLVQTLAWQLTWNGLPTLLRHGDRNAMAHSIESRVPFLTKDIAEFCLSLPEEYLVGMDGTTKRVFRSAMRGIVPNEILERKDKIGFETPEEDWLSSLAPWVDEILAQAGDVPYLKVPEALKEWKSVKNKTAKFNWRIWRWINYVRWVEMLGVNM